MSLGNRLQPVTKSKTCLNASINVSVLIAMKWKFGDYITPNEIPIFPEFHFFKKKSINISFHIEAAYFKSPVLFDVSF